MNRLFVSPSAALASAFGSHPLRQSEYQVPVDEKLRTADELYGFMIEEFHQAGGFFLEIVVVVVLVFELFLAFGGHSPL